MDQRGRSTEDIRQDIAREEEKLSRTVHEIGDRLKQKLDWSEYVKNSPYSALGIAVGTGFLVSRVLPTRKTPTERMSRSLAKEIRESLGDVRVVTAGPSLARVTLLGIATKLAADWIRNAISTHESSGGVSPPSQAERDSTIYH